MAQQVNIGIDETQRKDIAAGLSRLLAYSYTLYLKTHNYHWNVTGPMFNTLHLMFEEHYTELATAVDEIAERIRALGEYAPGSYKQFAELSEVKEADGIPTAMDMVADLAASHETVARTARSVLPLVDDANDEVTLGLLGDRMTVHEKTAWMLRALLEG